MVKMGNGEQQEAHPRVEQFRDHCQSMPTLIPTLAPDVGEEKPSGV
jgi:hypothetical protein